jgi:ABC-2 type transport system ATP-binding protein
MATQSEIAIDVQHVSMSFGKEQVLFGVNHGFEQGLIHGIVGNNGSGKTVLMKCICGFLIPTQGQVLVDGQRIGVDCDFPDDLGLIIETPGFLPNLSGYKNLKILARLRGRIGEKQLCDAMVRVGLDPDLKRPVGKYSLGMRQRLGIAQAMMEDPALFILDEPFNGLDKHGVSAMHALLQELRARGKTILLASHNATDIETLCDTVCEMDAGRLTVWR